MNLQKSTTSESKEREKPKSEKRFYVITEFSPSIHISTDQIPIDHKRWQDGTDILCNRFKGEFYPADDLSLGSMNICSNCEMRMESIDNERYPRRNMKILKHPLTNVKLRCQEIVPGVLGARHCGGYAKLMKSKPRFNGDPYEIPVCIKHRED